jgi:hypothetical protein
MINMPRVNAAKVNVATRVATIAAISMPKVIAAVGKLRMKAIAEV